jgi:hypothetical protein
MAEQELNGPQISCAGFEKMDGECVPTMSIKT